MLFCQSGYNSINFAYCNWIWSFREGHNGNCCLARAPLPSGDAFVPLKQVNTIRNVPIVHLDLDDLMLLYVIQKSGQGQIEHISADYAAVECCNHGRSSFGASEVGNHLDAVGISKDLVNVCSSLPECTFRLVPKRLSGDA